MASLLLRDISGTFLTVAKGRRRRDAKVCFSRRLRAFSLQAALSRKLELAGGSQHDPVRVHAAVAARHVESFFSDDAERAARCEMALDESVLNDGVNGR